MMKKETHDVHVVSNSFYCHVRRTCYAFCCFLAVDVVVFSSVFFITVERVAVLIVDSSSSSF